MTACILIVEDDPEIQHLLKEILEDHGYRIVSSPGGDAPALARREHPDLVLLDLYLYPISGQEVQGQLHADPTTMNIPIIVISALSNAIHIAGELGADSVLQKPFSVTSLEETITDALTRAQQRKDNSHGRQ